MPDLDQIFRYFHGVWRMMLGHRDGIDALDVSAEGFWNSFFALVIALPPLLASWVAFAANVTDGSEDTGLRFAIVIRSAMVDFTAWLLPLLVIGLLARTIGISKRYATFVVATNWGSALLLWIFSPITLLQMFFPGQYDVLTLFTLLFFAATIVLGYRLTFVALQRPHSFTSPFFACLFFGSMFITVVMQNLLGIGFTSY